MCPDAPDSLTVAAPESVGQEEELEAECHTSPSLPAASLYWTVEVGGVLLTPQAQTEVRLAPGGGFLSVSSLRLRPGRGQTVRVKCEARYKHLHLQRTKHVQITSKIHSPGHHNNC